MARGALVADFQVDGVAIPVVAGFIQVRILGQDDLLAMCPDLLEAPLALPVVAGGGEIAMLRPRHRDAAVVDPRVSAIASPPRAEAPVHPDAALRREERAGGET